jgi:hypothetical protein
VAAFSAGQTLTAADLIRPLAFGVVKQVAESVTSSTALQDDNELFVALAANTTYKLDLALLVTETTGTTADIKLAWTQPAGCRIDAAAVGAHVSWNGTSGAVEVEFGSWQGETGSPTTAKNFGTINAGISFGYHVRGTVVTGANAGTLRLQWAQVASVAEAVTVQAGSSLILTPIL